jgi:outer membrane autotransporter protein
MAIHSGDFGTALRISRSGRLLAGVSGLALTISFLAAPALAGTYHATDDASLRAAIASANADPDPSATVVMDNDIFMNGGNLQGVTKPITIDTNGHTYTTIWVDNTSGTFGTVNLNGTAAGSNYIFKGNYQGATIGAGASGNGDPGMFTNVGKVIEIDGTMTGGAGGGLGGSGGSGANLTGASTLTNKGTITGGSAINGGGGLGINLSTGPTLVNIGTIKGGDGSSSGGAGVSGINVALVTVTNSGTIQGGSSTTGPGGDGVRFSPGNRSLTNRGTIQGGDGVNGGWGVNFTGLGTSGILTNSGTIKGGNSSAPAGGSSGAGVIVHAGLGSFVNSGTITGGNGAAAVANSGGNISLVNSGTLNAGAGYDTAILMQGTQTLTLELHNGSVINGKVVGNNGAANTLILSGDDNASFDVSNVGSQYQNFTAFQKTGNSIWILTGTGTVATPWSISAGTLQLGDGSSIIGDVADNATLAFDSSAPITFAGNITGTGVVVQSGSGTTTLSGVNTYSGGTLLNSGVVSISSDGNLGDAAGALTFNGGTLRVTGTAFTSTARAITLNTNGGSFDIADAANVLTLGQPIAGSGGLTKLGTGTLTLTAVNSYSGATIISAGALAVTDADGVAASSGVRDDGVFDISASGASIKSLSGSGVVNLGTQALTITAAADTFGGAIQGTGDLHLSSGTQTLTGASTYGGDTYIDAGELRVAAGGQVNNATNVFFSAGTLTVTGAGSAFTASGDFIMGRGTGTAVATVSNGAHLTTGRSFLGEGSNYSTASAIQITVDGAGSVWNAGSYFQLSAAAGGTASLTVSNGGIMTVGATDSGSIGRGGDATALVTGAGSQLLSGSSLEIGVPFNNGAGRGQLTIADGGLVTASTVALGYNDGVTTGNSGTLTVLGAPGARGVLETASLSKGYDSASATFDGGILRASGSSTTFISSYAGDYVTIGAGGMFIDSNGFNVTASSALSGAGALTKQGAGTLILSGNNGYAGGTTIAAGVLQLGDGSASGSILGNVADNGTLAFNRTDAVIFSGIISGGGAINQIGSGTTTLTGANTYGGGTMISSGTLIGSVTSFGTGAILDGAALVISQPADAALANAINGTGSFVKQGAGRLNYTGMGGLSGPTTVAAGTLSVNGSLMSSAVTVQSGGTLGGNGTVGATTIQAGGTIAPGNSIGTLHVDSAYAQAAGSVYQVQVDPNSNASDLIAVNGTATLAPGAGINVTKIAPGDYRLGTIYTILTATNGVTGTYAFAGDAALSPYIGLRDSYDANNAYLKVVQTGDPASAAGTPNQAQTATGTDSVPNTSGVGSAVLNTPDPVATRSAFNQLSGEALASSKSALVSGSLLVRDTSFDRLRDVFCTVVPDEKRRMDAVCSARSDGPAVWVQGFGSWGHTSGDGNAAGLSQSTGGFLVGVDIPVYDWRVGYFGGFSRTDFSVNTGNSSGNSNNYHLGLYGGTQWGALGLRLGASYSWNGLATDRSVVVGALSNDLRANYNAGTRQVFGELGQRFAFEQFTLEPFANAAYLNLRTDGFSEAGGDAALTAKADTVEDIFTTLGVRPSTSISWDTSNATIRGMAGWRHTFGDVTPSSTVSFAGSDTFTVAGVPIVRDAGVVEAGLDFTVHDNVTAGITYGGQFGSRETDHSIRGAIVTTF